MHGSHAYLAWIAIEVCDGVYIHQLVGKLKPGDIPADVRVKAIDALVNKYFRRDRVVRAGTHGDALRRAARGAAPRGLPPELRLLRHLIVGRDHAGVGDYYGPFDAQKIFLEIPRTRWRCKPLYIDWTFWCYECGAMASMKTCPHDSKAVIDDNGNYKGGARLLLSGTLLRKLMSEGKPVPAEFSKPEVIAVLKEYYDTLEEKVEVKLHGGATGDVKKSSSSPCGASPFLLAGAARSRLFCKAEERQTKGRRRADKRQKKGRQKARAPAASCLLPAFLLPSSCLLRDQHRVAVRVEAESGGHRATVRREHRLPTGQRRHHHQQRRAGQVEIGQQRLHGTHRVRRAG